MSRKPRFRTLFDSQHAKGSLKFVNFFHHSGGLLSWKMSLLVISETSALFVNTLTAKAKYFLRNNYNLRQPIQMQLSKKQNTFSGFFAAFLKLHQTLNILNKEMTLIAYVFRKLQTAKNVVRQMSKKLRFRILFDSKHVNGSQTLVKSA